MLCKWSPCADCVVRLASLLFWSLYQTHPLYRIRPPLVPLPTAPLPDQSAGESWMASPSCWFALHEDAGRPLHEDCSARFWDLGLLAEGGRGWHAVWTSTPSPLLAVVRVQPISPPPHNDRPNQVCATQGNAVACSALADSLTALQPNGRRCTGLALREPHFSAQGPPWSASAARTSQEAQGRPCSRTLPAWGGAVLHEQPWTVPPAPELLQHRVRFGLRALRRQTPRRSKQDALYVSQGLLRLPCGL